MSSKYDSFWMAKKAEVAALVEETVSGRHVVLDVSDIKPLGNRRSWYGRAVVRGNMILTASMAHADSLARLLVSEGTCTRYPDITFTFSIDTKARLRVTPGESLAVDRPTMILHDASPTSAPPLAGQVGKITSAPPLAGQVGKITTSPSLSGTIVCAAVHALLAELPNYSDPREVPFDNGLYFFYEQGETSQHAPEGRVVRVGNHPRANHRLVRRLLEHYANRFGAKNSSVFRRYLGGALIRRDDPRSPCLYPSPGLGHWERQHEHPCDQCSRYEFEVSEALRRYFRFRCVRIDDQLQRNRFEELLVATIGSCRYCRPSERWLGGFAYSAQVRESGLWNSQFLHGPTLDAEGLRSFQELVEATAGRLSHIDLPSTLLLIPCSASKSGSEPLDLPSRTAYDYLDPSTHAVLEEGRRKAFSKTSIDQSSPQRPALEYYSGMPYVIPGFRKLLAKSVEAGLHCLIVSGGYGLLRPEEPIHWYEAYLPKTANIWRPRFPSLLADYVRVNRIRRTFAAFSTQYAATVPAHLAGEDWRFVPRFSRDLDSGSAMKVVPERIGQALMLLLANGLEVPGPEWRRM